MEVTNMAPRIDAALIDTIKGLSLEGLDSKALGNAFAAGFETKMIELINASDAPQFKKDEAIQAVKDAVAGATQVVSDEAAAAVGGDEDATTLINDALTEIASEITYIINTTPAKGASWLMLLAAALGQIADEKLGIMMEAADNLNNSKTTGEDGKVTFGSDSGALTAASKVFAIIQETMTNVLKTTGDGITTAARK